MHKRTYTHFGFCCGLGSGSAGFNDSAWRERIGNAVPRKAGKAIADVMLSTLMLSEQGETFVLSSMPVWVQPLAIAVSVSREGAAL